VLTKIPRGTKDITPGEIYKWHYVEDAVRKVCRDFDFREIRFPTFEYTELFKRGVGDSTDVVQKEMYTFLDRDERSITLRPEGTASTARAFLQNSLYAQGLPLKLYYLISCFRYEKPQAGRLREFHQFGAEIFGAEGPLAEVELISLLSLFFARLGLSGIGLFINSLGCEKCRPDYQKALFSFFSERKDKLCSLCNERLGKNPMRIIDCKNPECKAQIEGMPKTTDYLCSDCKEHFEKTKEYLTAAGILFSVDHGIVRGLDYYNRTVFEFVTSEIGAQGTVCGGGRYDTLTEQIGGRHGAGAAFIIDGSTESGHSRTGRRKALPHPGGKGSRDPGIETFIFPSRAGDYRRRGFALPEHQGPDENGRPAGREIYGGPGGKRDFFRYFKRQKYGKRRKLPAASRFVRGGV